VKEEAYGLAAAAAGILVGIGVSQAGLTLLGAA
jgi:hypothetical protein